MFTDVYRTFKTFHMFTGVIGDWKNWFTVAENELFDSLIEQKLPADERTFIYE